MKFYYVSHENGFILSVHKNTEKQIYNITHHIYLQFHSQITSNRHKSSTLRLFPPADFMIQC